MLPQKPNLVVHLFSKCFKYLDKVYKININAFSLFFNTTLSVSGITTSMSKLTQFGNQAQILILVVFQVLP